MLNSEKGGGDKRMKEKEKLFTSEVDDKNRITIPKEILNNSNLKLNSTVIIECQDNNTVCIYPKK